MASRYAESQQASKRAPQDLGIEYSYVKKSCQQSPQSDLLAHRRMPNCLTTRERLEQIGIEVPKVGVCRRFLGA